MAKRTNTGGGAPYGGPLHIESLESRQLLSGTPVPALPLEKLLASIPAIVMHADGLGGSGGPLTSVHVPVGDVMPLHETPPLACALAPELNAARPAVADHGLSRPAADKAMTVRIFLGNGDGTFQTTPAYTVSVPAGSAVAGDVNHDGVPDLTVANDGGHLRVLPGDGSLPVPPTAAAGGMHLVGVGDYNRDGLIDIAVAGRTRVSAAPRQRRQGYRSITPPPPNQAETQRTKKGRAIFLATTWELAELMQAAAKGAETESRDESHPSGLQREMDEDVVGGPQRQPRTPVAEDAAAAAALTAPQAGDASPPDIGVAPASPAGQLLAGLASVDLPALERQADAFFRQVENLAEQATDAWISSRLAPWLVIGAVGMACYALVGRRRRARVLAGIPAGGGPLSWEWSWLSRGAMSRPGEKS